MCCCYTMHSQNQQFLDEFTPAFITSILLSLAALYTVVCNYETILDAIAHSEWVDRILSFQIKTQPSEKKYVLAVWPEPVYIDIDALRR
jgi:hypothetical protein